MKLEVGMYVKTEYGISKIEKIKEDQIHKTIWCTVDKAQYHSFLVRKQEILKASHNIIDLIEVGDYVNGEKVTSIESNGWLGFGNHDLYLSNEEEIETVVTKEMFFNAEYRVKTD